METEQALTLLRSLQKQGGVLLHISDTHACGIPTDTHVARTPAEQKICDKYEYPITDHRHFVKHPIVKIEGPDEKGLYTAYTEDGSWRRASAPALLKRLTESSLG